MVTLYEELVEANRAWRKLWDEFFKAIHIEVLVKWLEKILRKTKNQT